MHIAVCMDIAADRKQLERLLGRSADRRLEKDPLVPYYVQSFGNKEALLLRPLMYDLFFIDLTSDTVDSVELIRKLRAEGVVSTIVLCPGSVDLSDRLTEEDNALILRQPVKEAELEQVLDIALAAALEREPKLDIRGQRDTVHVKEDEFLYAKRVDDLTDVYLTDDRKVHCYESIDKFWSRCGKFPDILYLSPDLVVHSRYIMSTGFGKVELKNGEKFRVSNKYLRNLKPKR